MAKRNKSKKRNHVMDRRAAMKKAAEAALAMVRPPFVPQPKRTRTPSVQLFFDWFDSGSNLKWACVHEAVHSYVQPGRSAKEEAIVRTQARVVARVSKWQGAPCLCKDDEPTTDEVLLLRNDDQDATSSTRAIRPSAYRAEAKRVARAEAHAEFDAWLRSLSEPQPQLQPSQHQELPRPRHVPAPLSARQQQHARQLKQQRQGQRQWEHQPGSVEGPHALIQLIERPDSSSAQPAGTASAQPLNIVAPPPRRVADAALASPFANAASPELRIAPTQSWPTIDIPGFTPFDEFVRQNGGFGPVASASIGQ